MYYGHLVYCLVSWRILSRFGILYLGKSGNPVGLQVLSSCEGINNFALIGIQSRSAFLTPTSLHTAGTNVMNRKLFSQKNLAEKMRLLCNKPQLSAKSVS
jgi:hypothetical protein